MVKLQIDPRIPKEWRAPIEFLESVKDEKAAFIEDIIDKVTTGTKNPRFFILYLADNFEGRNGINARIDNYLQKINLAINRLDKIETSKYEVIEIIQENLMKQQAILTNLQKDFDFILTKTKQFVFKELNEKELYTWKAFLNGILNSLKDLIKKISQERGGLVQSQLIEAALNNKKAA